MMNPSIKKLTQVAAKSEKLIIGLMSGTSLDGLDIALCRVHGSGQDTEVSLKKFTSVEYPAEVKNKLAKITSVPDVSLEEICLQHSWLGNYHGKLINNTLAGWEIPPSDIDCIASHGQTIYHAPAIQHERPQMPDATLQIGDGDHIARTTNILTISDFRQKHTAAGGEGAPMASFVDPILFGAENENRILLNIGGIANFTWIPAAQLQSNGVVTTDTGPGNTLIDAAAHKHFNEEFDKDGKIARRGSVDETALRTLKQDPYFDKPLPKTTGPEVFNLEWVNRQLKQAGLQSLNEENLVATLTRLSAETIADAIKKLISNSDQTEVVIYGSGGGIHNPVLWEWLNELLPNCTLKSFEEIGFDPDAKEAVIFAVLANEALSGTGFPFQNGKLNFGKISFPE